MTQSFRFQLAARFTATMTAGVVAVAALAYVGLRESLDRQLESSLLNVASIQAASVTDDPTGEMRFHEWDLTPQEAKSVRNLARYAQIWSESGRSLLRSQFLSRDLPLDTAALEAAAGGRLVQTEGAFQGMEIRSLYYPLGRLGESHSRHVLQVAASLGARNRTMGTAGLLLGGIVLLVSGGTFAGSWWLAGRAVRPVEDIIDQAEEIGAGSLDSRIRAHAETLEYRRLVEVLNTMLDRIDAAFEAQRRFTADASHELRSPLTALRGELELALRRDRSSEEYRRVLESALEEAEQLSAVAEDLLTLARSDAGVMEPRREPTDLADVARSVVANLGERADEKQIRLRTRVDGEAAGCYDPQLLQRALRNLVENAVKFTTPGGTVEIAVSSEDGRHVMAVEDTGPGIREDDLPRIFDRFYQADVSRHHEEGSGLGLSIVRAVVEAHGGRVGAENRESGGARFRIVLPS